MPKAAKKWEGPRVTKQTMPDLELRLGSPVAHAEREMSARDRIKASYGRCPDRLTDPFAWALMQADALAEQTGQMPTGIDAVGLSEHLEDFATDSVAVTRVGLVVLMSQLAAAARTAYPDVLGDWRSCAGDAHARVVENYRPSMSAWISTSVLWSRAVRHVRARFAEARERLPQLPTGCPFVIDELVAERVDFDRLVDRLKAT
jgi:hypothetical protein